MAVQFDLYRLSYVLVISTLLQSILTDNGCPLRLVSTVWRCDCHLGMEISSVTGRAHCLGDILRNGVVHVLGWDMLFSNGVHIWGG